MLIMASQIDVDKKLSSLEYEIKQLKAQVEEHNRAFEIGEPILEKVETKSILDKLNLSPELMLRFDKLNYRNGGTEGENTLIYSADPALNGQQRRDEYSKSFDLASSIRFRLNMDMELDEIKFNGRMLYMNTSQTNQRLCILSRDIKSGNDGSAFDVDRAYVDYSPNKNSDYAFTFSFGLLPTTGGTPMQYGENRQRSSLFPALVFDMNTYGMIATQKIADDTFVRLVLAKPYTLRTNFYPYQCNRENIDNADIVGLYSDSSFSFLGKSLVSFGANVLHDLKAHPYLGPDVGSSNAKILGTMATFGLGMDIEEFASSGTTIFAHTAMSHPHGNGEKDDYKIVAIGSQTLSDGKTANGSVGFTEADYASGTMLTGDGYSLYLGAKYDVNKKFNVGAELNYGSKYWFSATQGAEDMYNKLALRGTAYELYGVWKFHKYLNAKVGYLNMHEDYTGSGWHFGEPAKKDATQDIGYLSLEARF